MIGSIGCGEGIGEFGRGWGRLMIGCLTETTSCVVAKPLVLIKIAKIDNLYL